VTALLLAVVVLAQPPEPSLADQLRHIPLGKPLELQLELGKELVRYFTLEEFKVLMDVDFRLQAADRQIEVYSDIDVKYGDIVKKKDEIITGLERDKEVLGARSLRMEDNWHKAEKLAIENAGGPIWPYIVAAAGAVVGIVGVTLYLSVELRQK